MILFAGAIFSNQFVFTVLATTFLIATFLIAGSIYFGKKFITKADKTAPRTPRTSFLRIFGCTVAILLLIIFIIQLPTIIRDQKWEKIKNDCHKIAGSENYTSISPEAFSKQQVAWSDCISSKNR